MYITIFKEKIKKYLGSENLNITLFWKGRVGLYAILKAIGLKPGEEVILPAYTCVVVANAIIYLGGKPVYVDVDPLTYNIDLNKIESKITSKTRFILSQNTYGLSSDLDPILALAQPKGIHVIEDCAHGFGGEYKGRPNGTLTEAAFFSTQWNKPFSTGLGGIVVTQNIDLHRKLSEIEKKLSIPTFFEVLSLRLLYLVRKFLLKPVFYWKIIALYRWLSKKNLILGSSQGIELERPDKPKNFEKGLSDFQAKIGVRQLNLIDILNSHRRRIAQSLHQILLENDIQPPFEPSYAKHSFLKYPVLVKDRAKIFQLAERYHIEFGDWFLSPLHPILKDFNLWGYQWGNNPIAEKLSQHVVNLPTHLDVDDNYLDRIADFIKGNKDLIFENSKVCLDFKST